MSRNSKTIVWLHGEIKTPPFTLVARIKTSKLLRKLQEGFMLEMPKARTMPSIGPRCLGLRIHDTGNAWRVICFIDDSEIVVLDIFRKKTRNTPEHIINICQKRLNEYLQEKSG
jgi:phage-related protein